MYFRFLLQFYRTKLRYYQYFQQMEYCVTDDTLAVKPIIQNPARRPLDKSVSVSFAHAAIQIRLRENRMNSIRANRLIHTRTISIVRLEKTAKTNHLH
ncbi:MAG: hypothetical protein B9S37_01045 [Verrucomicrobiia bacterium Tous-C3TDCM]|nr:MAG: hypothetical protein B9S37_01045 [Verrucomicrobiae bacterium Tous-C3TDCM]